MEVRGQRSPGARALTAGVRSAPLDGVDDTYELLLGEWHMQRAITNRRWSCTAAFSGTATVAQRDPSDLDTAEYLEAGTLRIGAHRGAAQRRLRYVRQDDGTVIVTFPDGRTFLRCDLRSGWGSATHLCGDDRYDVTWRLHTRGVLVEEWQVRGPQKDYVASTVLRRLRRDGRHAA